MLLLAPAVAIAITIFVSQFFEWIENWDALRIENISVRGTELLSKEEVRSLIPGVMGENLLQVDGLEVARSLKRFHRIESVSISKRPPGTLVIEIRERVPVAALVLEDGTAREVHRSGMSLEVVSSSASADLPVITGAGIAELSAGEMACGPLAECALRVISHMIDTAPDLVVAVSEIDVRDREAPRLVMTNGSFVYLSADSMEEGIAKLRAGYHLLDQLEVSYSRVDLRFSHRAVVVPKGGVDQKVLATIAEGSAR
jgi:cell division protein FtsQ